MKPNYILLVFIFISLFPVAALAASPSRYFYSGDGSISLDTNKGKAAFTGQYRKDDGSHDEVAMRRINQVFQARFGSVDGAISPRLIEFLDYLQDHFLPKARMTIISGYRSPQYNMGLRSQGKLAAKASLHQYAMACDMEMHGVAARSIWEYVKDLRYGGVGHYGGKYIHLDVGPARFWEAATTGIDTDKSDDNKLIGIISDKDIYIAGEPVELRFIRMTAFPIAVSGEFSIEKKEKDGEWKNVKKFNPQFGSAAAGECSSFNTIAAMAGIKWQLPDDIAPGRYRIVATFCDNEWADMPKTIATPEIEVR